jgi:hypothetical protein
MPALGAAFAVLAAFAVADAASGLREAEADVSREANAAARLAWAATAATDGGDAIQANLLAYVDETISREWRGIDQLSAGAGPAFERLVELERAVRVEAASDRLDVPQRSELLAAVDDVSGARRARFAAAEPVAAGVIWLLVLTASALVINATVLTIGRERRAAAVLAGLVLVTGVSIATVVTLGAPFSGSFGASTRPLADVATDLRSDRFQLGT